MLSLFLTDLFSLVPGIMLLQAFGELYNGYSQSLENDALQKYADEFFQRLNDADIKDFSKLENVFIEVKRKKFFRRKIIL